MIVEQTVDRVNGLLLRWKCPGCDRTATAYPGFALPYKRYTLPTIQAFCQVYVENPPVTYRRIVDNHSLLYPVEPGGEANGEAEMEHSTIHRWISTLGSYPGLVQKAAGLILQADPITPLCRDLASLVIAPRKYMSAARKQVLLICFQLLTITPVYRRTFKAYLFPKLATDTGFT